MAEVAEPFELTLFGLIETTRALSVATGAVEAALTAAVRVPSVIWVCCVPSAILAMTASLVDTVPVPVVGIPAVSVTDVRFDMV